MIHSLSVPFLLVFKTSPFSVGRYDPSFNWTPKRCLRCARPGLHLESEDFQFLGQLDDRVVTGAGKVWRASKKEGRCFGSGVLGHKRKEMLNYFWKVYSFSRLDVQKLWELFEP